jgi:hypothetical protein
MKKLITILSAALFSGLAIAQTYNSPESVEFDYANNRWFIANNGGNNILARNSATGALSIFVPSGFAGGGPHGLEIVGDTLYACAGGSLRWYDINTGALVSSKVITGASFLNGITHDASGNLYITDYTNNKIFRFNTNTRTFNAFVSTGLSSPNGIIYDQPNNRCVFVQWTGAVKSVLLSDSTVTTLVASTGLSSIDGITKDGAGNYYLSSWSPTRITRYSSTFTSPATVVSSGIGQPADIFYNVLTDTLGVPNSSSGVNNTTYHYFGSATSVDESSAGASDLQVYPNPVAKTAEIKYELETAGMVKAELFDMTGKVVMTLVNEEQSKGSHTLRFDRSSLSAGNYFLNITANDAVRTKKVVITK